MTTYPTTLYQTPETWSNITMFLTREKVNVIIDWLAGREDITKPAIDDTREWELVETMRDAGVYQMVHSRENVYVAVKPNGDGQYEWAGGEWLSLDDAFEAISNNDHNLGATTPLPGTWKRLGDNDSNDR